MDNEQNKNDEPAFPVQQTPECYPAAWGLTKREWFAGMAMQGLISSPNLGTSDGPIITTHLIAQGAVNYADALLAELSAKEGK